MKLVFVFLMLVIAAGCGNENFWAGQRSGGISVSDETPKAFAEHQVRYMSPFDLMEMLKVTFPVDLEKVPHDCKVLTASNRALVGDSSVKTGSPIFTQPSSSFVRWYARCVNTYLDLLQASALQGVGSADPSSNSDLQTFLGPHLFAEVVKESQPGGPGGSLQKKFSALDSTLRKQIVLDQIERMIGPSEVIADFAFFPSAEGLGDHVLASLDSERSTLEVIRGIHFLIALRDEFLSY